MTDDRRDYLIDLILTRLPELAAGELNELLAAQAETPVEVTNQIFDVVEH